MLHKGDGEREGQTEDTGSKSASISVCRWELREYEGPERFNFNFLINRNAKGKKRKPCEEKMVESLLEFLARGQPEQRMDRWDWEDTLKKCQASLHVCMKMVFIKRSGEGGKQLGTGRALGRKAEN